MQSVSSRIWTRVAVFISYDDNNYTTGTSTKWMMRLSFKELFELFYTFFCNHNVSAEPFYCLLQVYPYGIGRNIFVPCRSESDMHLFVTLAEAKLTLSFFYFFIVAHSRTARFPYPFRRHQGVLLIRYLLEEWRSSLWKMDSWLLDLSSAFRWKNS